MNIFAIALGGFIGAILRYSVGLLITFTSFPLETIVVNIFGSFLLGWVLSSKSFTQRVPTHVKLGLGTGMLGSFTTYSTFSLEVVLLFDESILLAMTYVMLSVSSGLLFAWFGVLLGRGKLVEGRNR